MHNLTDKYVSIKSRYNPNLRFLSNEFKNFDVFALQGGTRSGKTYSTLQHLWRLLDKYSGVRYSMVRATLPSLKATVLQDFIDIGSAAGLYNANNHNLTDKEYHHNGNVVDYFSCDDPEKIKGRKRDVLYVNEAPEIPWPIIEQLLFRTGSKVIMDFNPSYPESWMYENILTRKDCAYIVTTYLDNPHIPKKSLDQILWAKENDPEAYKIYGLGERGEIRGQIYKHFKHLNQLPGDYPSIFVMDFGFSNDPTCLAEFKRHNNTYFCKEHIYLTEQDNLQIGIHLFFAGVNGRTMVIADSAEPKSIAEFNRGWSIDEEMIRSYCHQLKYTYDDTIIADLKYRLKNGYQVIPALKGPDSVLAGIQKVKQKEIYLTDDSINGWAEYTKYEWAENPKTGLLLNVPVDKDNHFMDCLRMFALADGVMF